MGHKEDAAVADRVLHEAVEYLMQDGWPTKDIDEQIADRLYRRWVKETEEAWAQSGYRDRDTLRDALEKTFAEHYGEDGAQARLIIFSLVLECRARREGTVHQGRPAA